MSCAEFWGIDLPLLRILLRVLRVLFFARTQRLTISPPNLPQNTEHAPWRAALAIDARLWQKCRLPTTKVECYGLKGQQRGRQLKGQTRKHTHTHRLYIYIYLHIYTIYIYIYIYMLTGAFPGFVGETPWCFCMHVTSVRSTCRLSLNRRFPSAFFVSVFHCISMASPLCSCFKRTWILSSRVFEAGVGGGGWGANVIHVDMIRC